MVTSINKKELNSNKSKQNILNAAQQLFAKKGFECTTSKDIAELAACSEGLIFKYFRDKKNLFNILIINWINLCVTEMKELPPTKNLEDEIRLLISYFFYNFASQGDLNKMLLAQRFNGTTHDDLVSIRIHYLQNRDNIISSRLKKYQASNELSKTLDIIQLIEMIVGYTLIEVIFRNIPKTKHKGKINSLVKLILSGIKL